MVLGIQTQVPRVVKRVLYTLCHSPVLHLALTRLFFFVFPDSCPGLAFVSVFRTQEEMSGEKQKEPLDGALLQGHQGLIRMWAQGGRAAGTG